MMDRAAIDYEDSEPYIPNYSWSYSYGELKKETDPLASYVKEIEEIGPLLTAVLSPFS